MSLGFKNSFDIVCQANVQSAQTSAKLVAGNIINDRLLKIIKPKVPMIAKG